MTPLSIFGLFAVTAMLVCYALEARSRWFILAFAGSCGLGSVYGFLQGAWPFGLVEATSAEAPQLQPVTRRWRFRRKDVSRRVAATHSEPFRTRSAENCVGSWAARCTHASALPQ